MTKLLFLVAFILSSFALQAQIDTEFWFAAPEVTANHADRPVYLRISSLDQPANVTISQPANPAFSPVLLSIGANSTQSIDLSSRIALLENDTPDLVENKGLLIQSSSLITAYYEVLGTNGWGVVNCDIFSLKGRNALGKKFYTPFQNYWDIFPGIDAWSSFDIVATEDATMITITPSQGITGHSAGVPFSIMLNKGQTYSARALGIDGPSHLSGSLITSTKPIAVTTKDDSIFETGNYDLAGDQIIPVDLTGQEYVVIKASGTLNRDRIFICATENATDVSINGITTATIQEGETFMYQLSADLEFVTATKPIYVFHITGFENELGGALLPPVGCTGSRQVGFTRPTIEPFALNIVVKAGGEAYFRLNGSTTLIEASDFSTVPGTGGAWKAAHIILPSIQLPAVNANTLKNDSADFHLGILNGSSNTGFRYGYFSDYGVVDLGENRSICKGDSIVFNGGFGMSSYLWNTGETSQYITVKDSGNYSVKIKKGASCILKDSIDSVHVSFHPDPRKVLGSDTTVCSNTGFQIKMDTLYSSYHWQNGSTSSTYSPTITGIYWVEVKNQYGCKNRDSIHVTVNQSPRPVISYPNDLERVCLENTITLNAGAGYQSYRWNNGATSQTIVTPHLPEYYVVVTDFNNCTDSTNLYVDCSPYVKVYNLFTPNGDGLNDVFYVENLQPGKWILEVYTRWGDRIYYNRSYSNDFEGKDLNTGVYYYILRHVEDKKVFNGWVNIIKSK